MDWITERVRCGAQALFEQVRARIMQDIEQVNTLAAEQRQHCRLLMVEEDDKPGYAKVQRQGHFQTSAVTVCTLGLAPDQTIVITSQKWGQKELVIRPSWNNIKGKCELSVQSPDSKEELPCCISPDDLWKISQYVLEPLAFS